MTDIIWNLGNNMSESAEEATRYLKGIKLDDLNVTNARRVPVEHYPEWLESSINHAKWRSTSDWRATLAAFNEKISRFEKEVEEDLKKLRKEQEKDGPFFSVAKNLNPLLLQKLMEDAQCSDDWMLECLKTGMPLVGHIPKREGWPDKVVEVETESSSSTTFKVPEKPFSFMNETALRRCWKDLIENVGKRGWREIQARDLEAEPVLTFGVDQGGLLDDPQVRLEVCKRICMQLTDEMEIFEKTRTCADFRGKNKRVSCESKCMLRGVQTHLSMLESWLYKGSEGKPHHTVAALGTSIINLVSILRR